MATQMQESNVIRRVVLSLRKLGVKATILKTISFCRSYLPKSPIERTLMLRYRYTVDPMELEEPALQAPEYQDDIDFGGLAVDVRAIVFFDPSAERFETESAMVQELSAAAAAAAPARAAGRR